MKKFLIYVIMTINLFHLSGSNIKKNRSLVLAEYPSTAHQHFKEDEKDNILIIRKAILTEKDLEVYKNVYKEIYPVEDYYSGRVEFIAIQEHNKINFSKVIALTERDILRAGSLRSHFGIKGQQYDSALAFRDKFTMMKTLYSNIKKNKISGVRLPKFAAVMLPIDIVDFVRKNGLPVIIKPRFGESSGGITIIDSEEKMYEFISTLPSNPPDKKFIVEEFIKGDLYIVDGYVVNKKIKFLWPSKRYGNLLDSIKSRKAWGTYLLDKNNPEIEKLKNYATKIVQNMPFDHNSVFDMDIIIDEKTGEAVLCEVTSRSGGMGIKLNIDKSFGINLTDISYELQNSQVPKNINPLPFPETIHGYIHFPRKIGKKIIKSIKGIPNFDWLIEYSICAKEGEKIIGTESIEDSFFKAQISAKNTEELTSRAKILEEWVEENIVLSNSD